MLLSKENLVKSGVSGNLANKYYDLLSKYCGIYHVNTKERLIAFLSNVLHESNYLKTIEENLNYSKEGLLKVFSKYFNSNTAAYYARQPIKIANRVYANRMGNGTEASGDGWKYRGKGLIQVTGKNNHRACGLFLGKDLITKPETLLETETAVHSAFWFWQANNLNQWADKVALAKINKDKTKAYKDIGSIINFGSPNKTPIGWVERLEIKNKLEKYV